MSKLSRGKRGFRLRAQPPARHRSVSMRAALTAALGLLCTLIVPDSFAGQCTLGGVAEFPITMVDLRPQMTAKINGTDVRFMVDSGAFWSVISPASAAELNLSTRPTPMEFSMRGANGSASTSVTKVKEFTLPGVTLHNVDFLVGGSQIDSGGVGVLGQNILHFADVEFDLRQGVVRLIKPVGCGSTKPLAYWAAKSGPPYSEIDIESRERTSSAISHASINGTDIRVLFDSGAGVSTLTLKAAARVGVRPDSPGVVPGGLTGGFGKNMVPSYIAPFESFKIGDEEIRHTRLRIADLEFGDADMLIGPDFFLSHRILIANSQQRLYFTYNGGPVFNLTPLNYAAAPGAAGSPAAASPGGDAAPVSGAAQDRPPEVSKATVADNADAADFSRRGAAMAARGDYDHALTALSRACSLAPDNPEYFFQRSRLYMRMGNRLLAGKDLDQTLKLNPQHVAGLVLRAELLLANGDVAGATADLDAASRTATKQEDLRYEMGEAYESVDRLSVAVEQFDLWIAAHVDDERIPYAQNDRCWARALSGGDLSLALKDCNAALKRAEKGSPFYAKVSDTRGLVFLRLGDYPKSIADYDAAIAIAPKIAWSWYGRGIDKLRQHQTAAGDADIVEAESLSLKIAEKFTHYGISP
jgi:predicted aspartyl protease/tetratricopeptide (TPR) repeat protein